jgi:hypothetical protein
VRNKGTIAYLTITIEREKWVRRKGLKVPFASSKKSSEDKFS